MRHIRDAQKKIDEGNSAEAMAIVENLLGLASRNPDALRMKSEILDSWGRFDESLHILKKLSQVGNLSNESIHALENCALEEKEAFVYSELTPEGRWYYAFPRAQVWIALFGFLGCGIVLLMSPHWLSLGIDGVQTLLSAFAIFVVLPCLGLIGVHCIGIKKILVGPEGLRVCKRFSKKTIPWASCRQAVVEHDNDRKAHHLKVHLYDTVGSKIPMVSLDISRDKSVVKARRHFLRNVLSHIDVVSYLCRNPMVGASAATTEVAIVEQNDGTESNTAA